MLSASVSCVLIFGLSILLAWPLGKLMTRIYKGEKNMLDFLAPFENFIFKFCKIDPSQEMNWKQYVLAMLVVNSLWFVWAFVILLVQGKLFLNPAGNPSMEWTLALNSAISFVTATNLQHYSGESGATYFSQLAVFMFLQFLSAATSLAAGVAVVRGLVAESSPFAGNFYNDFVKSITRILLPLSLLAAILFMLAGIPMTFHGPQQISGVESQAITVATGPVAAMIPIKELGANGGGFFGANDAHPFENPDAFAFILHCIVVFLLPMAFVLMVGHYAQHLKFGRIVFALMAFGFLLMLLPIVIEETSGNPLVQKMGIDISAGNMEGKEVRFGSFLTAFYCGENVAIPAGTYVGVHDSFMPWSSITMLLGMSIDAFFGGAGTGWINMFLFLIVAVFIGTLMIGRTPELFGKKIEIVETQIAVSVIVLQSLLPMVFTAIACFVITHYKGANDSLVWLSNCGPHGFTTMLYEYVSSAAGNGSEFSGLGNNTPFWNLTTAAVMLVGRFAPIIGALSIAGLLREKQWIPASYGSLKVDTVTFGTFLLGVIIVVNTLSLLVVMMLGPVAEHYFIHTQ